MSVYKKVQLPNRVMSISAAKQSCEGDISITTDDGLYVLKPRVFADQMSHELIVHVARIPPITEVYEFDVGIKHETIQREIQDAGEIHGDFLEVMLNRTLSPQIESLQANRGFVMAVWSPEGGDIVGRPVMAGLTGDHRLDIISRVGTDRAWERVVSISEMYQKLMTQRGFGPAEERCKQHKEGGMEIITQLKERTYLLAGVAAAWSPIFIDNTSIPEDCLEPKSKVRKVESRNIEPGTERGRFSYLVQASKSGHISLWKVKFPVSSKDDVTFVDVIDLHTKPAKVLCWCSLHSRRPGVLAVGYNDGVLKLLPWKMTREGIRAGECLTIFEDVDNIRINAICLDESKNILYVGKGPYLFALLLEMETSKHTIKILQRVHLAISPRLAVNEISLIENGVSVSASDDIITIVKCEQDEGLRLRKVSSVKTPHEISGPLKPWRNHGVLWTRNHVFAVILSSPGWNYCHLEYRKPLKVHFVSQKSTEQIATDLLSAPPDALMSDFTDSLAFIKQIYYSYQETIPPSLLKLEGDQDQWESLSFFQLKLLRNLLKFQLYHKSAEEMSHIQEHILRVEGMVRTRWISIIIKKVADSLQTSTISSSKQLLSLSLICEWLGKNGSKEEKDLVERIRKKYKEVSKEICNVCEESVTLSNLSKDACINGHYFGRCSHTLLLCQDVPYRVCEECGALATTKDSQALPLPAPFLEDTCPICDHKLMLP